MTIFNPAKPKERNNYLLEIENTATAVKQVKKTRFKGGFSLGKKLVGASLMLLIATSTLVGGLALNTGSNESQTASAALINPEEWVCVTKDDDLAYVGGSNSVIKSGWNNEKMGSPNEGLLAVGKGSVDGDGKANAQWTALEQYGYFSPTYTSWQGRYVDTEDDKAAFVGTGGDANGYGSIVTIEDPGKSVFFSHQPADCLAVGNSVNVAIANAVSYLPKMFIAAAGELYQWSNTVTLTADGSPLKPIAEAVKVMILGDGSVAGLRQILFLDFLSPIVILAAIGLIWTGIVKRSSIQAGQSAIWMIGAATAGMIFLTQPLLIPTVIDDIAGKVNASVRDAFLSGNNSVEMCSLKDAGPTATTAQKEALTARTMKCVVWYSTIYVPWVSGQFGENQYRIGEVADMNDDPNTGGDASAGEEGDLDGKGLKNDDVKPTATRTDGKRGAFAKADIKFGTYQVPEDKVNWALYQLDTQSNRYVSNEGLNYSEIAYNRLVVNSNSDWKGASGAIGVSFLTLLGAIGPGVVIISISFALIAYQLTMLFLMAFAPVFFLVGVAPGWGRRIAMRWLELLAGILAKRIVLTLFLLLFIKLYMLVIAQTTLTWFFQAVLVGVLSYVAMTQRSKIIQIFTGAINFGSRSSWGNGGMVSSAVKNRGKTAMRSANRVGGRVAKAGGRRVIGTAGNAVAAPTRAARAGLATKRDVKRDERIANKVDPLLGIGDKRALDAHNAVNGIHQIRAKDLNETEHKKLVDADGTINKARGQKWLEKTKSDQAVESQSIAHAAAANKAKVDTVKAAKMKRSQKQAELSKLREDREAIRSRQAKLNKDVKRIFGEARYDKDGKQIGLNRPNRSGTSNNPADKKLITDYAGKENYKRSGQVKKKAQNPLDNKKTPSSLNGKKPPVKREKPTATSTNPRPTAPTRETKRPTGNGISAPRRQRPSRNTNEGN